MTLTRIRLEEFTAFKQLDLELSPGINVFVGANGTGKTHLLKVAYCACDVSKTGGSFSAKLLATFLPFKHRLGRLVHRAPKSTECSIEVCRGSEKLRLSFSNHAKAPRDAKIGGKERWTVSPIESAYVPVKEMLANAPGFRSLYAAREVHFEEIYNDIIDRAFRPVLRGPQDATRKRLLTILQQAITGKVVAKEETLFLKNKQGDLEFTLLAEGMRKLALLWLLLQNGTLLNGSVLFWDEPETNLNPKVISTLMEVLLELQRMGVQILLATHDYVVIKELDLRSSASDKLRFHSLFHDSDGVLQHRSTDEYLQIDPNAISETFLDLFDRDVRRDMDEGR